MSKKLNLKAIKVQSFVTLQDPSAVRAGAAGETLDEDPCTLDTIARDCQVQGQIAGR